MPKLSWKRSLLLLTNYFLGYLLIYPWLFSFILLGICKTFHLTLSETQAVGILNLILACVMMVSTLFLIQPLRAELKRLREIGIFRFLGGCLKIYLVGWGWMIVANLVLSVLFGDASTQNQQSVIEILTELPIVTLFLTTVYAPIVEEAVFRGAIFNPLYRSSRFMLGAIVSSMAFGFIHVMDAVFAGNLVELAYILPYAILGYAMACAYRKYDTIVASMTVHFFNNFVSTMMLLLLIFAG